MALLRGAGVARLLDVRLRPDGHLSAYARQRDLRYVLERYEGIAYEHRPELAPTGELLDGYRADGNWDRYRRRFQALLRGRDGSAGRRRLRLRRRSRPDRRSSA